MTTFAKFGVFDKEAGLPGPVSGPSQGYPAGTPFRAVSGVPRQTPFRASRGVPRGYPARPRFRGSAGRVRRGYLGGVSGVPWGTPGGTPADPVSGGRPEGVRRGYPGGTPGVPRGVPRRTPVPGVGRGVGGGWGGGTLGAVPVVTELCRWGGGSGPWEMCRWQVISWNVRSYPGRSSTDIVGKQRNTDKVPDEVRRFTSLSSSSSPPASLVPCAGCKGHDSDRELRPTVSRRRSIRVRCRNLHERSGGFRPCVKFFCAGRQKESRATNTSGGTFEKIFLEGQSSTVFVICLCYRWNVRVAMPMVLLVPFAMNASRDRMSHRRASESPEINR